MKLMTAIALVVGVALLATNGQAQKAQTPAGGGSAASAAPSAPQVKPSAKAAKAIVDLQDAINKKDWASVPAKVAAAQAVASTKEDRYLIGSLQLRAAAANNDAAAFGSALETVAQSGVLNPATLAKLYANLGGTYLNNKQFPQAAAAYQKAVGLDPSNVDNAEYLAEAQNAAGQKAEAAATYQHIIQARTAAGQKPDENMLRRAVASAYESKSPAAVELARQWVGAYPSPTSWSNAIGIYMNLNQPDAPAGLDMFRLMQATGALNNAAVYGKYAATAFDLKYYDEAQAVLDAGTAAKLISPADPDIHEIIAAIRAKPRTTAADLEAASKAAANGTALLGIGDRYYAMGNYSRAVELYRMAQGKPGVDPALANLQIGIALARAGDKAGATAALNAVTGPRAEVAKYWLLYVNQKA